LMRYVKCLLLQDLPSVAIPTDVVVAANGWSPEWNRL